MIRTIIWINWLALRRDTGAFLMTFVLPPLLFVAFAAIFSNAPGRDVKLKLVVADLVRTGSTRRLVAALEQAATLRVTELERGSRSDVEDLVRRGVGDTGLVIVDDLAARSSLAPLAVIEAPDRPLAASMALGQAQRVLGESLPDVLLTRVLGDLEATGAIDADDRAFLDKAFAKQVDNRAQTRFSFSRIGTIYPLPLTGRRNGGVLQYAAAVSAIFLLFGGMQGAYVLIDERDNGIADRIKQIAGGAVGALAGRFIFLVAQGTVQVTFVYLTAYTVYGATVDVARLPAWLLASVSAAAACAGMALLASTVSRTRKQAELWTTFVVLLLSAIGGSMVPRYLMPAAMQAASWWTPNAWIMQALQQATLPGQNPAALFLAMAVLVGIALSAFALSVALSGRGHAPDDRRMREVAS